MPEGEWRNRMVFALKRILGLMVIAVVVFAFGVALLAVGVVIGTAYLSIRWRERKGRDGVAGKNRQYRAEDVSRRDSIRLKEIDVVVREDDT